MNKKRTAALWLLVAALLAGALTGCSGQTQPAAPEDAAQEEADTDYSRGKIGIITGSAHDGTTARIFPEAERVYFNTMADMVLSVEQGKIDCYVEDSPFLTALVWEGAALTRVGEPLTQMENGFVFPQNEESRPLREEVNAFLAKATADGTVQRLQEKWLADTPPTEHPDYTDLTGEKGTIRMAVSVDNKPLLYQYNGLCTGFEMELLTLFARENGYAFEIEVIPFESVITGIAAGKYDMAASSLNITPEREESVDFSDPYSRFDVVLVSRKTDTALPATDKTLEDMANARLGILTGSIYEGFIKETFPDATISYFSSHADIIVAMEQGKLDGFVEDHTIYTTMCWENAPVAAIDPPISESHTAAIFTKGEDSRLLREQFNAFLKEVSENGTLAALESKWIAPSEPAEHPDYTDLTGENGTLKVAVSSMVKPLVYIKNNLFSGFEIELITLFARENGYKLEFENMTFDGLVPAVSTGRCDIGLSAISITEERKESVTFSDPYLAVKGTVAVYAGEEAGDSPSDFRSELKENFEKTFLRENRWKLILDGVGITVLISLASAAGGTVLGFGLYLLSRSKYRACSAAARGVAKVYSRIIAGTPVVVVLMILFYVVFGSIRDISGVLVAIIGFSLTFGAFVYDTMAVAVGSVDRGQTEAAYALGYTRNQTFFHIICPQAMSIFLPGYCGEMVSLVKATAVVGYIAVNDLTKVGDIIRSNTYEAFFPLIATAVIYFLLTWALAAALGFVKRRFEPKRRSAAEILKGVNVQ